MPAAAPFITQSNAQALAKLSWTKRRERAEAIRLMPPPKLDADPGLQEKLACIREQLEIVAEQIKATRLTLNDRAGDCAVCKRSSMEPHHRAQLLKALDTLLDRQRIPTPGQLKPTQQRSPRNQGNKCLD